MSGARRKSGSGRLHRPQLKPDSALLDRQGRRELAAVAVVVGGGLLWWAWPEEETGRALTDRAQCANITEVSRQECEAAYDKARADHARLAPRFSNQYDCEAQFGRCDVDYTGGHAFIPPMAGFLLDYHLGSRRGTDDRYGVGGALPLYRDRRDGGYFNPHGERVAGGPGVVRGDAGRTTPPMRAITVSRAGFGSTASARSSFGG